MLETAVPLQTSWPEPVELRRLTAEDAEVFAAHVVEGGERLRRFLTWPDRTRTAAGARTWLENYDLQLSGHVVAGGMWSGGTLLGGAVILRHDEVMAVAELGVWAAAETAGTGVAAAACRALIAGARAELRVERLEWQCSSGNVASRRLAERLGFRYEGTARSAYVVRGERHDVDVLSLVGDELG